jgi:carboxyl-terminal processing protease
MKSGILIIMLLAFSTIGHTQTLSHKTETIASFCKIWGLLKYYHPEVSKGTLDWDQQAIEKLSALKTCDTKEKLSLFYVDWINQLGIIEQSSFSNDSTSNNFTLNINFGWINDTTLFTDELIRKLNEIRNCRVKHHHYVKKYFSSPEFIEKTYKDSIFPTEGLRLIGLFRYWNIINYYYPYKYLTDKNWNDVLVDMIPRFQSPSDTIDYHMAMLELVVQVNDSHAYFKTGYTKQYFGEKYIPYQLKIIENMAIITGYFNDSLCHSNKLRIGDVIIDIDGIPVEELISEKIGFVCGSNRPAKLRNLANMLACGQSDSVNVTINRHDSVFTSILKRYSGKEFNYKWNYIKRPLTCNFENNIGYINMGLLKRSQIRSVMKDMMCKKILIIDLRCYPKGTGLKMARYLNHNRVPFSSFLTQNMSFPGMYSWAGKNYCGKENNKKPYEGKVIVLINEETQSQAEFTCMALKTVPDVVFIGSQTAGADGNVSTITFPGGYKTNISGIGVFYPDGGETQRIGIVPDIVVKPTIAGVRSGKDEILERAIEYANQD